MTFQPDDHVVYPGYGAGTIVGIEDKVFVGTTTRYYMLKMVADEGEFMVPVDGAESLGIRPVLQSKVILKILQSKPSELPEDYKERQAEVMRELATSDAAQMSQAARNLAWYAGFRQLTGRDVQLYEELQTLLASELALALDVDLEEARNRLTEILAAVTEKAALEKARIEEEEAKQAALESPDAD